MMNMYNPSSKDYIPELGELFNQDGTVKTGDFLQELAQIMYSANGKRDVHFSVKFCEKVGAGRFLDCIRTKCFTWDEILPFLFEKCGEQGWDILCVEQAGPCNGWWTYAIYVVMR